MSLLYNLSKLGETYELEVDHVVLIALGDITWDEGETTEILCASTILPAPSLKLSLAPSVTPCESDKMEIIVILDTDRNGDQTYWEIA